MQATSSRSCDGIRLWDFVLIINVLKLLLRGASWLSVAGSGLSNHLGVIYNRVGCC